MELSILVAKMLSLLYIATGISAFAGQTTFQAMLKGIISSRAVSFTLGFIALISGVFLVQYHNFWVKDWTVLITIIGWVALVKGFFFIAYPDSLKWFQPWFKNTQMFGTVALALGLLFGYFGFII